MSNTTKTKQKKNTTFGNNKNVKNMLSLTERIKETRMKESERKCDKAEKHKKRSKHMIRNYSSKDIADSPPVVLGKRADSSKSAKRTKTTGCKSANKAERKAQSLQSTLCSPDLKESLHSQAEKSVSKEVLQANPSRGNAAEGTNKTIFVSLDFIEDCQKYKKKFMRPMCEEELKKLRKSLRNISSYHKRYLSDREQQNPKSQRGSRSQGSSCKEEVRCTNPSAGKSREGSRRDAETKAQEVKKKESPLEENSTTFQETEAEAKAKAKEAATTNIEETPSRWGSLNTETFSVKDPVNEKPPSEDVSTVDNKYIELLMSIANCKETKQKIQKKNQESEDEQIIGHRHPERKIITGKAFFENKIKKEQLERERKKAEKNEKKENEKIVSQDNTVFARLVRDLTKSEVQIHHKKGKNLQRHTEIQSEKKTAHSKPEVNDNRKKRKARNNALTNNNEEVVEMPFPNDVSKVADVKELWRREIRKKSENSLSSNSSSTVQEKEDISESKNLGLESYKLLRKIVEEEVKTICKKFVEEKTEKQETQINETENETEGEEESRKLKDVCKELRSIMSENTEDLFETNGSKANEAAKRRMTQKEDEKTRTNREEKKQKDDLLKYLDKYESEDFDGNLDEEKKKLPSETVKNWSILHRLEKAFLALGTPTFPNHKGKDPSTLKTTGANDITRNGEEGEKPCEGSLNQKTKKLQNLLDKKEKKSRDGIHATGTNSKYKNDASETRNSKLSSVNKALQNSERKKLAESESKHTLQKEKPQVGKSSRNCSRGGSFADQKVAESEDKSKQKKGKCQSQKPNVTEVKKSPPRSLAKPKVCEFESRYSKRDVKQKKCKHIAAAKIPAKTKSLQAKENETKKRKLSKTLLSSVNRNDDENLERKKTFDVIPFKDSSKIKARKSKSCNKIDDSLELDNAKKRFPPTRTTECKTLDFWDFSEVNPKANSNIKSDMNKMKPVLTRKSSAKDKPLQLQERPKTVSEKECSRGNRESLIKPVKERNARDHEKKSEKAMPLEDITRQVLTGKESPKGKSRAVKERSILSIRGIQHGNQPHRKRFLNLQGKTGCNFVPEPQPPQPCKASEEPFEKDVPKDVDVLLGMCTQGATPESLSFSCVSTCTFNVQDCTLQGSSSEVHNSKAVTKSQQNPNESEALGELSSLSSVSISTMEQQQQEEEMKCLKSQQIWEHDIKQYRAIVKEIMSQYKRIDGFLKQNEHSQSFPRDSVSLMSEVDETNNELSKISKNLQEMNIHEYRKKILSEYQALPIFEYKTKIQQEAGNTKTEEKRRNLSFVKALKTEMDVDVKDFQPNIQKILDSQLYVDTENLFKRNEPFVKFNEKNSSLQEIVLSKNEKTLKEEECLRCISTPKTFPSLPRAKVHSSSAQNMATAVTADDSAGLETFLLKI